MRRRWIALACALMAAGCASSGRLAEGWQGPNPFGTPFRSKQELLAVVRVGMPSEEAQAVLRAHGFERWRCLQQDYRLALVYHVCEAARLRNDDAWVTLDVKDGVVEAVDFRTGPAPPDGPAGIRN